MKREQMREIIRRNREALGLDCPNAKLNEMALDAAMIANDLVCVDMLSDPSHAPAFLADGLIVGYEV